MLLTPQVDPAGLPSISPQNYEFLKDHIYRESGIVLENGKLYLLGARLMPIVARRQLGNLNELCALMKATGEYPLRREVVEAMTTNETQFFRDIDVWDGLRTTVIPELQERHKATRLLRLWSAASSSGQEAYTLAILLLEMGLGDWAIQIVGTDISEVMLEQARRGRYKQLEVSRGLPTKYLVKYFTRQGMDWELNETVRRLVRFQQLDLRGTLSGLGPFDLVMCRNVLIYFDIQTKKSILQRIRGTLHRKGYLVLGGAETTLNLDSSFNRQSVGRTVFYTAP
jgi:chemotaxis protein methyltransferase CheR